MPGSIYYPRCSGCRIDHEIHTGTSTEWDSGRTWAYTQMVCDHCQRLISCRQFDDDASINPRVCATCGGELRAWEGQTWHETYEDGSVGAERVEGPCPTCQTTIGNGHDGREIITITLWD